MEIAKKSIKKSSILNIVGCTILIVIFAIMSISSFKVILEVTEDISYYGTDEDLITMLVLSLASFMCAGIQFALSIVSGILSIVTLVKAKNPETIKKAKGLLICAGILNLVSLLFASYSLIGALFVAETIRIGIVVTIALFAVLGMLLTFISGILMIVSSKKLKNALTSEASQPTTVDAPAVEEKVDAPVAEETTSETTEE